MPSLTSIKLISNSNDPDSKWQNMIEHLSTNELIGKTGLGLVIAILANDMCYITLIRKETPMPIIF